MKAMNEFESLLVIAGLILALCAIIDPPLTATKPGVTGSGPAYVPSGTVQAQEFAQQVVEAGGVAVAGNSALIMELQDRGAAAPASRLQFRLPPQPRASW